MVASTRRSWTREQKLAIVGGIGDATLSEVARRHGIHTSLLFRWRRELEPAVPHRAVSDKAKPAAPCAASPRPGFVPVLLLPPLPLTPSPPSATPSAPEAGVIEIELAGGRTMRMAATIDTTSLAAIIAALEGQP